MQKRREERSREERPRDKAEKKVRDDEKPDKPAGADGVDADIAGMVPGPQPIPEEDPV